MRFFASTLPFITSALAAAVAEPESLQGELASRDAGFKVNYYTDGGCTDYLTSVFPFTDGSCYDYSYTGDNSANIANCDASNCECIFYTQSGCGGASQTVRYNNANCASNFGRGFLSMMCHRA
ncbi:hypothetical protein Hte_004787 [Hypoxylon texense]